MKAFIGTGLWRREFFKSLLGTVVGYAASLVSPPSAWAMGWILEPGESTAVYAASAEVTVRKINGLPAGVSTRPSLPADLAAGDELFLVASQTPVFGSYTVDFTAIQPRTSGDDSGNGSGEVPPGHRPPPTPRPVTHIQGSLLVRPASSEFVMFAVPSALTVEQGGASPLDVHIDRTGATYRNPVTLQASAHAPFSVDPGSATLPGNDTLEQAALTVSVPAGARLGRGQSVTVTASGNVSPAGQPANSRVVSQVVETTIVAPGDFQLTLAPSTLSIFRNGDTGQIGYQIAFTGSVDTPPFVNVEMQDLPSGVVADRSLSEPFFTLRASAGAVTGTFTAHVRASAFFNGARKVHTVPLTLTVVNGYTLAVKAVPATIQRNAPAVIATVAVGRAEGFIDPAAVSLALPTGLSASPASALVLPEQTSVDFAISANCDASLGDAVVYVAGGTGFAGTEPNWHLQVVDDFSLAVSPTSITLVNGGDGQVLTATVAPGQCALAVSLSRLPASVTYTLAPPRPAEMATDAIFTLTAADAQPGTSPLTVTASVDDGLLSKQATIELEVRDPKIGYAFTIDSFTIRTTRAPHEDTDVVAASLMVDDVIDGRRMLPVQIQSTGDVNNGEHPVNMTIFPAIAIKRDTKLTLSYVILNNGAAASQIEALQTALNLLADVAGDIINVILDKAGIVGSAVADSLKLLIDLATANCDGIVAIDTWQYTGAQLHDLTQVGTVSYSPGRLDYPGNLPKTSEGYKQVYESSEGCGKTSDYSVSWHVQRRALADHPEVTTDRSPGAVISAGEPVVVVTDRYGTLWTQKYDSSNGWQGFDNLGLPLGTVAGGAPVVLVGPSGTGALDVFVVGAPQTSVDSRDPTGRSVFVLRESSSGTWTWVNDQTNPPGEQAASAISVVTVPGRPTMAFVVSEQGKLWERQLATNGWLDPLAGWRQHGSPDDTILVPGGLSAVVDAESLVRVFAVGRNNHLYQLIPAGEDPTWRDLGAPPMTGGGILLARASVPMGPPSFAATEGFIGGLVRGQADRHVYLLASSDGAQFSWADLGAPPTESTLVTGLIPFYIPAPIPGFSPGWPSLIANEFYVGALVVDLGGSLSELYRDDSGYWHWVSVGPAMGSSSPRVAISDPSYVDVANSVGVAGYRGGFMNGLDGHVYEASTFGGSHAWSWTDHSA